VLAVYLSLFAVSCLISQSAMDLFSTLVVAQMLVIGWQWRKQGLSKQQIFQKLYSPTGFDVLFLIWFAVVAAGFAYNAFANDFVGSLWLKRLVEFKWIFIFYLMIAAFKELNPSEKVIKYAAAVFAMATFYAVVIWFLGMDPIKDIPELVGKAEDRTGGFFSDPMTFAHSYGQIFCWFFGLALSYVFSKNKRNFKISSILILTVLISGLALLLSFTRGVWIGLFFAILVMLFLQNRKYAISFAGLIIVVVIGLMSFWPAFKIRVTQHMQGADQTRVVLWQNHWQIFLDHPLLGTGYGENTRLLPEYYKKNAVPEGTLVSHAHNQYLHLLAGTGLLGTLVYLLIWAGFLGLSIKLLKTIAIEQLFHRGLAIGLLGSQVEFLISGLTEANFEHSKVRFVLMFTWTMVVWLSYEYRVLRKKII
jgi:hypothetical protein